MRALPSTTRTDNRVPLTRRGVRQLVLRDAFQEPRTPAPVSEEESLSFPTLSLRSLARDRFPKAEARFPRVFASAPFLPGPLEAQTPRAGPSITGRPIKREEPGGAITTGQYRLFLDSRAPLNCVRSIILC